MAVGDRISELLQSRQMTQKQLAAALSLPITTLNGYIRNRREPDYATLRQIARLFGVSCDYLLENLLDGATQGMLLTAEETALTVRYRGLTREQQELVQTQMALMQEQNTRKK